MNGVIDMFVDPLPEVDWSQQHFLKVYRSCVFYSKHEHDTCKHDPIDAITIFLP